MEIKHALRRPHSGVQRKTTCPEGGVWSAHHRGEAADIHWVLTAHIALLKSTLDAITHVIFIPLFLFER